MFIALRKTKLVYGLLALGGVLNGPHDRAQFSTHAHVRTSQPMLMIRVSQESRPGLGDFDRNTLGFISALQSTGTAEAFYHYYERRYGNSEPVLTPNTSHVFFVNASDGISLFVVHNTTNRSETGEGGTAQARWELSGGTARVLVTDDSIAALGPEVETSQDGTVFVGNWKWPQANTDGMAVGALPVGFTLLGQFTAPPTGLEKGWEAISSNGSTIPLQLVPGQRVRFDVVLNVRVKQDH